MAFLWSALFLLAGCEFKQKVPRKYGQIADFELTAITTDASFKISKKDLLGETWIASFVFTSCNGPCPILSKNIETLQADLPADVSFVTFTIDPNYDTEERLRKYAKRFHADPKRWVFVRGEKGPLYDLLENGFQIVAAEDQSGPLAERFIHTSKFVLVDASGEIRGYYFGDNPPALVRLKEDVYKLLAK
jgi:protein SCO1/2